MAKISISLELSEREYKQILEGTRLLSQQISYERELSGKTYVHIDEQYFLQLAIHDKLYELQNTRTANMN